jgi:hypothetical protein
MTQITFFTAPKPFTDGHIATIQRNAIASWTRLPDAAVLLFGSEAGMEAAASELGVRHLPDVPRSSSGAPLIDAMFRLAREHSRTPYYCIINADIILMDDLPAALQALAPQAQRFVLLGQRWDLDVTTRLDLSPGWQERLRTDVHTHGRLHRPAGSDYFLVPSACYQGVPPFVIGRAGWDNWMIYHARRSGFPVVDATHDVMVVHQNHDYAHLPGGQPHYRHPETQENIRLAGGRAMTRFTLLDADRRLVSGRLRPRRLDPARLWRRIETWPLLRLGSARLSNALWRLRRRLRRRRQG